MEHKNCSNCEHQEQKNRKLELALKSIREKIQNPGTLISTSSLLEIIDQTEANLNVKNLNDNKIDLSRVKHEREEEDEFSQDVKPPKVSKLSKLSESIPSQQGSSQDLSQSQDSSTLLPLTPEVKALTNSLIIRKIQSFLHAHDLLVCRLVNLQFWEEATHTLLLPRFSRSLCITFMWSKTKNEFVHRDSPGTISDFHTLFSKSLLMAQAHNINNGFGFPCTFFSFSSGNLNAFDCASFLHEHGRTIKNLRVYLNFGEEPKTSAATLRRLFFEWLPNLQYLALGCSGGLPGRRLPSFIPRNQNPQQPAPVLPNLRILDLQRQNIDGQQLVEDILSLATNLEETIDPPLNFLDKILMAGKVSTVKIMELTVGPFSNLGPFYQFSEANPRLKELRFHFVETFGFQGPNQTAKEILENLLESSKLTLEKIDPLNSIAIFESIQIPVMEKVKVLAVETKKAILPIILGQGQGPGQGHGLGLGQGGFEFEILEEPILPENTHMVEIFPSLEQLDFRSYRQTPNLVQIFRLETNRPHSNVKRVTVQMYNLQLNWLRDLSLFCPQVKSLHIDKMKMEDLPEILKCVWRHFQGLTEFCVSTNYWQNPFNSPVLNQMDSAFTGYSLERVEHLRSLEFDDYYLTLQGIEFPSILAMRELKYFKLHIVFPTFSYKPVISKVSSFYAFNPMVKRQGLKVDIQSPFPVPELIVL